ncbi:MAG: HlyD family secretion protein [Alphaproteobacteria bacterium PRO2]|nr:HlyD family secretion protein [Alphaproteobacteria bacterium PRO2]
MSENSKGNLMRRGLMLGGILIILTGCAWFYLSSGRYITTDNAYIKAAKILITPQVEGTITSVSITDNQNVQAGDVLFVIDPASYRIAADEARADVANSYTEIEQLKARYRQKEEDLAKAQVDVSFTEDEYSRRTELVKRGAVAQTEFNETKRQRDAAVKAVSSIQEEINGILAALTGNADIKPEDHPLYQKALAKLHEAELDLDRTTVKAPVDGMIGMAPRTGDYARAGVPLLNLVGSKDVWIEANYKETELTDVKIGQPVTIEVDTYPGHEWQGHVESISPATGSEFSVLPAQNATGNWVKVVQRIAVRIAVDPGPEDLPLRTGMSTHVSIDIGHYPHGLMQKAFAKGR